MKPPDTFRVRVAVWCFAGFFILTAGGMTALVVHVSSTVYRQERHELNRFCRQLSDRLRNTSPQASARSVEEAIAEINDSLRLLFDEESLNLGYALYDGAGGRKYHFHRLRPSPFPAQLPARTADFFVVRRSYKDWVFYRRIAAPPLTILCASAHHFDVIDHLLIAVAVLIPLMLGLSLLISLFIGQRVAGPVQAIAAAVSRLEQGDMSARIRPLHAGAEIDGLVAALNHTFAKLEASMGRIGQFSADAAHELRTPLTALRGNLEVCLRRPRAVGEYQQALAEAIDDIARLSELTETLLILARADADAIPQPVAVDLAVVAGETVEFFRAAAEARGISLRWAPPPPVIVKGNEGFLRRLCTNLIHNAIVFSPADTEVEISVALSGNNAVLVVADHGIGIAAADQTRIFERFQQVVPGRSGGAGLGLALVKWVAESHGGSVSVDSAPGRGSRFLVRIPADRQTKGRHEGLTCRQTKVH